MQDSKRDTDVKNRLLDSVGEDQGGMIWENSIETYILPFVKGHQSRSNAWNRMLRAGALGWPWGMGWGRRWEGGSGWGTRVNLWLMYVNVWQKPLQYCKVISLQLKKKKTTWRGWTAIDSLGMKEPQSWCSGVSPEDKDKKRHQGVNQQVSNRHEVHQITELKEQRHDP